MMPELPDPDELDQRSDEESNRLTRREVEDLQRRIREEFTAGNLDKAAELAAKAAPYVHPLADGTPPLRPADE